VKTQPAADDGYPISAAGGRMSFVADVGIVADVDSHHRHWPLPRAATSPLARKTCSNDSPGCAEEKDVEATGVARTLTNAQVVHVGRRELWKQNTPKMN